MVSFGKTRCFGSMEMRKEDSRSEGVVDVPDVIEFIECQTAILAGQRRSSRFEPLKRLAKRNVVAIVDNVHQSHGSA